MLETSTTNTPEDTGQDGFPRLFGSYVLLGNFARGGMGEVFLAKHGALSGLERTCVVKKLRAELTQDREYVSRFVDEARVVNKLEHANICRVYDVGIVGDDYYLAMEYVSGRDVRTLQDRCHARGKPVPPAVALLVVCETLEALDYAHRLADPATGEPLHVVHRDVSPQNVLVSFEGEVKLIDFGLAASKLKMERTQPNVVMGKMAYMAPEQARGDRTDARADLFACAVLAYELLAGERFYEGMTLHEIWEVAGKGGYLPPRWGALEPELQRHLGRALHAEAARRFETCADLLEVLAAHLHHRHPGLGRRAVRDTMSLLFAEEIRREREVLARFDKVAWADFRRSSEQTQSQSFSLVQGDTEPPGMSPAVQGTDDRMPSSAWSVSAPSASEHNEVTQRVASTSPNAERAGGDAAVHSTDEEPIAEGTREDLTIEDDERRMRETAPRAGLPATGPSAGTETTQRIARTRHKDVAPPTHAGTTSVPQRREVRGWFRPAAVALCAVGVAAAAVWGGDAAHEEPGASGPPATAPAATVASRGPRTVEEDPAAAPSVSVGTSIAPHAASGPAQADVRVPDVLSTSHAGRADAPQRRLDAWRSKRGLGPGSRAASSPPALPEPHGQETLPMPTDALAATVAQEQEAARLRPWTAARVVNDAVTRCKEVCIDMLDVQPTGSISDEDGDRVRRCLVENLERCPRPR